MSLAASDALLLYDGVGPTKTFLMNHLDIDAGELITLPGNSFTLFFKTRRRGDFMAVVSTMEGATTTTTTTTSTTMVTTTTMKSVAAMATSHLILNPTDRPAVIQASGSGKVSERVWEVLTSRGKKVPTWIIHCTLVNLFIADSDTLAIRFIFVSLGPGDLLVLYEGFGPTKTYLTHYPDIESGHSIAIPGNSLTLHFRTRHSGSFMALVSASMAPTTTRTTSTTTTSSTTTTTTRQPTTIHIPQQHTLVVGRPPSNPGVVPKGVSTLVLSPEATPVLITSPTYRKNFKHTWEIVAEDRETKRATVFNE